MASAVHSTHLPPLGEPHKREEVGQKLRTMLVELGDLSPLGKRLWLIRAQFPDAGTH